MFLIAVCIFFSVRDDNKADFRNQNINESNSLVGSKYNPVITNPKSEELSDDSKIKDLSVNEFFMTTERFAEIMEKGAQNKGVVYVALSTLDPVSKRKAEEAIRNLYEKGSLSGGIQLAEFTELDKARDNLKREGINKINSKLDGFQGVKDELLNSHGLQLTGAQSFGRFESEKGWSGIYKLYEGANRMVEIEHIHLKPGESSQQLVIESMNIGLTNNTPATYETLKSESIEKLTFVSEGNYYQINGLNLNPSQLQELANQIIKNQPS